jgi:hypothetical protein
MDDYTKSRGDNAPSLWWMWMLLINLMPNKALRFKLEKFCDKHKLRIIAEDKGCTPREIDLLISKYSMGLTQAALEVKFSPWSLSTIKREIKSAKSKLGLDSEGYIEL